MSAHVVRPRILGAVVAREAVENPEQAQVEDTELQADH